MSNKLPPLSGPVDASREPAIDIDPFKARLKCDCIRHVFDAGAVTCVCGTFDVALAGQLRAAAVPSSPAQLDRFDITDLGVVMPDPNGAYVLYEQLAALPPSAPVADSPTWFELATVQPKDGDRCLVWRAWPGRIDVYMFERRQIGWTWQGLYGWEPTHWMPLPSAPSPSAGAVKESK